MQNFLKRYRHFFAMAGIVCAVLAVFGAVRVFALPGLSLKTQTTKLNTVTDGAPLTLQAGDRLVQTFTTDRTITAVAVLPDLAQCRAGAVLTATLADESGKTVTAEATLAATDADELPYAVLTFDAPLAADGARTCTLTLSVTPQQAGGQVAFARSADTQKGLQALTLNEKALRGSLTLTAETGQVNGFITPFFIVFALLTALALCAVYAAVFCAKWPLHKVYLVAVLCIGLLYMIILPPYSAPDEKQHINQAFNNAAKIVGAAPDGIPWGTTLRRASDANSVVEENATTVFTYREIAQNFLKASPDAADSAVAYDTEDVGGYQLPYALTTLGVLLGRWLHLGFVATLYLARGLNLLFFAFATYWAVKLVPFGKAVMATVCLLPMTLHVAGSFSRDSFTLAMAFLFTALALRAAKRSEPLHAPEAALLAAVCIVTAPAKAAYVPLILLLLMLPARRFSDAVSRAAGAAGIKTRARLYEWGYKLGTMGVSLAAFRLGNAYVVGNATSLSNLAAEAESAYQAGALAVNPDTITYNLMYLFTHLRQTVALLVNSVVQHGDHYLRGLIGGYLSNYNLEISWVYVAAFIAVLVLAAQCGRQGEVPMRTAQFAWPSVLAVLGCCGCVVLGCILWTPTYYTALYGLQGRYFLPMLPLALLLCRVKRVNVEESAANSLVLLCAALQALTLLNAFYTIALR